MIGRFILLLICSILTSSLIAQTAYHRTLRLMGTRFDLTVVAQSAAAGEAYLDLAVDEIQRIENLISSWDPNSQTSAINEAAGKEAIAVTPELFDLIERSIGLSRLTNGAFDISYASMDRIWQFDGSMTALPTATAIAQSVAKVGFDRIELDREKLSVYLPEAGMKIGFGGIGKGYAADQARSLLEEAGVRAGIINAAGDLTAWGRQPNGENWMVAITNPLNIEKAFAWLPVVDGAVVTSGNYEKFVRLEGVRYAHIIDPRTGYPSTGIVSVSVFAPRAELADALATSIFVMGIETGLDFINQLPGIECVIIDDSKHVHSSLQLELQTTIHED